MKSTIFQEILNEEVIEVNKSVPETIQYLYEQSGAHHTPTSDNMWICFECSKKGKISVVSNTEYSRDPDNLYPLYYVYGRVISNDNKTYIKIISVYKKTDIWLQYFWYALAILFLPLFFFKLCLEGRLNIPILLISLISGFISMTSRGSSISVRKSRGLKMVPLMENEIKRRVRNIERWDD